MKQFKTIFIANIWTELISVQFLELLTRSGVKVKGNWLAGKYYSNDPISCKADYIIYSPTGGDGFTPDNKIKSNIPMILWGMFPDYLLGWDFKLNSYKFSRNKEVDETINYSKINLAASNYISNLLSKTYNQKFYTWSPGLPTDEMSKIKSSKIATNRLKILWNHMWRVDKGFEDALKIINNLSIKYPQVEFTIARKEKWSNYQYSPIKLREAYNNFCVYKKPNVIFKNNYNPGISKLIQKRYWRFISEFDIGFSTSYHEGFGISMLEQASLGLACLLPRREVYPEIFSPLSLCDPNINSIQEKLESLIVSRDLRIDASIASYESSKKYTIESSLDQLLTILTEL